MGVLYESGQKLTSPRGVEKSYPKDGLRATKSPRLPCHHPNHPTPIQIVGRKAGTGCMAQTLPIDISRATPPRKESSIPLSRAGGAMPRAAVRCPPSLTSHGMLEARVRAATVHIVARSQLLKSVQALKLRRVHQPQDHGLQGKATIQGVLPRPKVNGSGKV